MFGLGFGELILIFLIALVFIGPKKLPELAKGLGKGIRDFQNAAKGVSDHLQEDQSVTHKKVTDATDHEELKSETHSAEKKDNSHS